MSFLETAEERAERRHAVGAGEDWLDVVTGDETILGSGIQAGPGVKVDMHHKPYGGEVRGMRETIGRMSLQMQSAGASPDKIREVTQRCATRMERRLHRGPKKK